MQTVLNVAGISYAVSIPEDHKDFNEFFDNFIRPVIEEDAKDQGRTLKPWSEIKKLAFPIMVEVLLCHGVSSGFYGEFTDTAVREALIEEVTQYELFKKFFVENDVMAEMKKRGEARKPLTQKIKQKREPSAYLKFSSKRRPELKQTRPDLGFYELTHTIAGEWERMSAEEKAKYK